MKARSKTVRVYEPFLFVWPCGLANYWLQQIKYAYLREPKRV